MNSAKFLQAFGLVALMVCVALITQSLTLDSIQKEAKEERITGAEPFIGEISMFAGNFAPRGWALCDGQLLSISSNSALFSILGTTYGGDGRSTFALPDLRGRVPIHAGRGSGLTPHILGAKGGQETTTLTQLQLPNHAHLATFKGSLPNLGLKEITFLKGVNSDDSGGDLRNSKSQTIEVPVVGGEEGINVSGKVTVNPSGNNQATYNMQPYQVINYIIALNGIFPPRS